MLISLLWLQKAIEEEKEAEEKADKAKKKVQEAKDGRSKKEAEEEEKKARLKQKGMWSGYPPYGSKINYMIVWCMGSYSTSWVPSSATRNQRSSVVQLGSQEVEYDPMHHTNVVLFWYSVAEEGEEIVLDCFDQWFWQSDSLFRKHSQ